MKIGQSKRSHQKGFGETENGVFTPIPSARVSSAVIVKPGFLRSMRAP